MNPLLTVPAGTVISTITFHGLASHTGIVSDTVDPETGEPMVIHNRRVHGTVEEPISKFCKNNEYLIEGYPGHMPAEIVVARARTKLGQPWNLFEWNCEDFVNYAHGLRGMPTQVKTWTFVFALIGVLMLALIATRKMRGRGLPSPKRSR